MKPLLLSILASTLALGADFVAGGVNWNQYAAPQVNGWGSYSRQVADRVYSFSTAEVTSVSASKFLSQISFRTGIATPVLERFGPFTVYATADVGVASSGDNVGGSYSGGGAVVAPLGKGWFLVIPVRVIKTSLSDRQVAVGMGIGWGR